MSLACEVELCDFEVAGLGDFEVAAAAGDDVNGDSGAFEEGGFVGADELVGCGFGEGLAHERDGCALRGLGVNDEFAGDGGGDEGAVGGALDLLDGVDGGEADDGGAVLFDHGDGALDGLGLDHGADGVVDDDDVVGCGGGQGGEGVGDGVLACVAAGDDVDAVVQLVLGDEVGDAVLFGGADGYVDRRNAREGEEGLQGVDEDGQALELEELLRDATVAGGHAGADSGGGEDDEYGHRKRIKQGVGNRE
jgi:hypothetical protein